MAVKVSEVYDFINSVAPFKTQEEWDNSGLLIGGENREVKRATVCLDVTVDTVEKAVSLGADLIVSHHPVIFNPIKSVGFDTPVGMALRNGISIISAHTNWDSAQGGVNDVLAKLLGLSDIAPICEEDSGFAMLRAGTLKTAVPASDFAELVSEALDTVVRVAMPDKLIQRIAVCGGAGAGFLPLLADEGVDAFVTGDAKHNDFLDAVGFDIALLAAGHYETETVSMPVLSELLKTEFSEIEFTYIESAPIVYIG